MKIQNDYSSTVFYRVFKAADTAYAVGLEEGLIASGKPKDFINWPEKQFKLELKKDGSLGPFIMKPGTAFKSDASYTIARDGTFAVTDVRANVGASRSETEQVLDYVSLDLRGVKKAAPFEKKVTAASSVTSSFEASETQGHANEFAIGVEGSAEATEGDKTKDSSSASLKVSAEFRHKAHTELTSKFDDEISSSLATEVDIKLELAPDKVNVIQIAWSLTYAVGDISYLQESLPYRVLTSATYEGAKVQPYDTHDDIPAAIKARLPTFDV